jgi:hypothetical protein
VLRREFKGKGIVSFELSRETTDSESRGIRPAGLKPGFIFSNIIKI